MALHFSKNLEGIFRIMKFKVKPLAIAKFAVSGVVGIGTNKIVKGIINSNVPMPERPLDRIAITAATLVLSAIVTKATKETTNEIIDDIAKGATEMVSSMKESAALERIRKGESTFEKEGLVSTDYTVGQDGKYTRRIPTSDEAAISKKVEEAETETSVGQ